VRCPFCRCGESGPTFECVGGAFFRAVLDDPDPRMAVYVSTFLLRRMASEQPDQYRAALQRLVFQAQQVRQGGNRPPHTVQSSCPVQPQMSCLRLTE
jgi:hypothetical protein